MTVQTKLMIAGTGASEFVWGPFPGPAGMQGRKQSYFDYIMNMYACEIGGSRLFVYPR